MEATEKNLAQQMREKASVAQRRQKTVVRQAEKKEIGKEVEEQVILCFAEIEGEASRGKMEAYYLWIFAGETKDYVNDVAKSVLAVMKAHGFAAAWQGEYPDGYGNFHITW